MPLQIWFILLFFLWQHWGLNLGPHTCYSSALTTWVTPLVLFCDEFFRDWVSRTIFPLLVSSHDPPDLCLLSSYDYTCEPPAPGGFILLETMYHKIHLVNSKTPSIQPKKEKQHIQPKLYQCICFLAILMHF
jgi:hypothetical protein